MTSKHADGKTDGDPKLMGTGKGLKAILGGLEELWDQSQYTEEYNLTQFLAKLNGWTAVTDTVYKVYSFWVRKRNFDILMLVLFFPHLYFCHFSFPTFIFFFWFLLYGWLMWEAGEKMVLVVGSRAWHKGYQNVNPKRIRWEREIVKFEYCIYD